MSGGSVGSSARAEEVSDGQEKEERAMSADRVNGSKKGWNRIPRRMFLKGAGAVAGAAALSGIPSILAAGQAPAYPKGTKLHLLTRINFIDAADKVFLAQGEEFGKQMGVEVMIERIGENDVMPRATSAIVSQSGPDIIMFQNNYPHLMANGLADVSDVAEAIGKEQGGYPEIFKANAYVGKQWLGVPYGGLCNTLNYREDWLKEAGFSKFPDTYDELRQVGKKLKSMGRPAGQCFGHSVNDPNSWCYTFTWAYGGYEVEKDGKTVALDKKGTLEAIKLNTAMWKDMFDEGGLSWDDASNNRAFLSGAISITSNAASIYFVAREKFPEIAKVMNHAPSPRGPAGRFYHVATQHSTVLKYSKNQKLAKEFIRWYMDKKQFDPYFVSQQCWMLPPTTVWYSHPLWTKDPKLTIWRDTIKDARHLGYAGSPSAKASETLAKYIIVDMFAKAIQGTSAEDSLKWATEELKKIYGA
jgi:multiple sugar transport system substrate-binding protein